MQINSIGHEELQNIIYQLEQALYNHQQWYNITIRALTCRLTPDKHDVSPIAHKECRFGQWYYEAAPAQLRQHPGFIELGEAHHQMHQSATKLLTTIGHNSNIAPHDYDTFANNLEKMHLELTTLQRELTELLYNRDPLTGAINRISMLPYLREQQELVKRNALSCTICMVDLDDFKKINDQYGHTVGDFVLSIITRLFISEIRSIDRIFRFGGEEFLLCTPHTDTKLAHEMIDRIRIKIEALEIPINKDKNIHITASFGLAPIHSKLTVEQSIEQADQALYKAKTEGKNCIRIFL